MKLSLVRLLVSVIVCGVTALLVGYSSPSLSDAQLRMAEYRRMYREAISVARSESERKFAVYESRIFEHAARFGTITSLVTPQGGIDEFEALVLAKAYVTVHVGSCIHIGTPELHGNTWTIALATGREAKEDAPILVHRSTGAISCGIYPTVADASAMLRTLDQWPNKAPEPTP
jgi:hypothetical protein